MKSTDSIQYLKGVGPKMANTLAKLGIGQINDLLTHYPRHYLNLSQPQKIKEIIFNDLNVIKAKVVNLETSRAIRKKMTLLKATLEDDSGQIQAIWFNQLFLSQSLKVGSEWIFYGKVERSFQGEKNFLSPQFEHQAKMIAIYPETEGISSKYLRAIIDQTLTSVKIEETLDPILCQKENLISRSQAIKQIHQPVSWADIKEAQQRIAFEEMLALALRLQQNRLINQKNLSLSLPIDQAALKQFVQKLPFQLTDCQKKAVWQILKDLEKPKPMNRLLNGDVGSGKTVVAAMVAYHIAKAGFQTAIMAPTEILAKQHYQTFKKILAKETSISLRTANIKEDKDGIEDKDIIIGTHALIQEKVAMPKLVLVVIDEQHRFGVKQREALVEKSQLKIKPHFLSMTATPIPRTLSLSLYGDLDISVLDELPGGRQKINTQIISPGLRQKTYDFIEKEINSGRQAYVICPLIEKKETPREKLFDLEKKTVLDEFQKLAKNIFPHRRIRFLHGKLKSREKEQVMEDFKAGKVDILVSTSVVEVGIDVPNATVMMIEGAESFGLAQLWQFRGRVGRGEHQSYCFLLTEIWALKIRQRLESIVKAKNGFELAEKDLALRGPGELAGISQSGLPDFKMASLTDINLISRTRRAAIEILGQDPNLENNLYLKEQVDKLATKHLE